MPDELRSAENLGKFFNLQTSMIKILAVALAIATIGAAALAVLWLEAKTSLDQLQSSAEAECLDPAQIAEITYSPEHENMVQLIWPQGSSGMLPWGSVLEADFDDGAGHYFTNVCNLQPIFDRLMCRFYGIGGVGDFDLQNREFWTIRVLDQRPFPHLGE